jgi:phytoene/squalene synthetase
MLLLVSVLGAVQSDPTLRGQLMKEGLLESLCNAMRLYTTDMEVGRCHLPRGIASDVTTRRASSRTIAHFPSHAYPPCGIPASAQGPSP